MAFNFLLSRRQMFTVKKIGEVEGGEVCNDGFKNRKLITYRSATMGTKLVNNVEKLIKVPNTTQNH